MTGKKTKELETIYRMILQDLLKFDRKPNLIETSRKHQSAYIQLKTDIDYLKFYFYSTGRNNDNMYFGNCIQKQTPKHIILYCKNHSKKREKMRKKIKNLPFTLQTLFCTKKGKEALVDFLVDTEVCTANWYRNAGFVGEFQ